MLSSTRVETRRFKSSSRSRCSNGYIGREILASHKDLANKLEALERKYDAQFKVVFDASVN